MAASGVRRVRVPRDIEDVRDACWCREGARRIDTAADAERFIERIGFAACLTDSRKPGPLLYVAVCGRRDAVMPRNVQKDEEASHTWLLKDDLVRRGKVYYAKLARGKTMFRWTIADWAKARPGIRVAELAFLLNLEPDTARMLAERAIRENGVTIQLN